MSVVKVLLVTLLVVTLSACGRLGASVSDQSRVIAKPVVSTTAALSATELADFLDPQAAKGLTENELAEAASAQYYALQFGRPGAPRQWQGNSGNSGQVTVGPYVRVNELDCRDFSHEVKSRAGNFVKSGTACREGDGGWKVV